MRGLEFRGKTFEDEWVTGHLTVLSVKYQNIEAGTYISNTAGKPFAYKVQPETVGQYIGVNDKHNTKVFDGDRLRMFRHSDITGKHEPNEVWDKDRYVEDIRTVQFNLGTFYTLGAHNIEQSFLHMARPGESFEVISNIHTS